MATFTITGDIKAIERAIRKEPKIARAAAISAINKTVAIAQTAGVRELGRVKKLPARLVKARTKVRRASLRRLSATLTALTAGLPIDRLKFRELKKGISAAGKKYPHAFIVQKTKALIFERKVIGGQRAARLPIERVKVELNPEASTIFERVTNAAVRKDLQRIFDNDLRFRLRRRG